MEFIKQAIAPTSKEELTLFSSMIQSNSEINTKLIQSEFLPNLSSQTANLRVLTQKHKKSIWMTIHQKEFENIRKEFEASNSNTFLVSKS